ncbi:MAG: hypothetical protein NC095_06695 [Muribaculum sp.]|nr:hypothetical protein [Muribaculum sp.]
MNFSNRINFICIICVSLLLINSCGRPRIPESNVYTSDEAPAIAPDYTSLVIPPNIAPLNFEIDIPGERYITRISGSDGLSLIAEGKVASWDIGDWHSLLQSSKGGVIKYEIYVLNGDRWDLYSFANAVAEEDIDPYISYRLIEPSYVHFSSLSICQRDLTSFDEDMIWNNPSPCDERRGYCINCHVPRNNYKDHTSLFHIRGGNGGTVIMSGDTVFKVNLKTDETISAGVYPAWHPTLDIIAFSTNATAQKFPNRDSQKAEVFDSASDIILYDMKTNEITEIASDRGLLETYPAWTPDGKKIFYSVARYPDNISEDKVAQNTGRMRYDIVARDFDISTRTFSDPDTVVLASFHDMSALLPRISPDGKWLLYCQSPFGSFHIWHKESDLFIADLNTGEQRPLSNSNSDSSESYHSWSSNSRWIVFSSRRDDGNYTRPYIAYISPDGNDSKAFVVPQKDPDHYRKLMKSYNVPEFLSESFAFSRSRLLPYIREKATPASFHR